MPPAKLHTPVVFAIFNRPNETARVFAEIRKAMPPQLFIIADGPRHEAERAQCQEARDIATRVDWPCQVHTNFSERNLGCGLRLSTGLDWVFKQVEEAIVLEDDCIPDPSFFQFCQELLKKYRSDAQVMHIAGSCTQEYNKNFRPQASYYFSIMPNLWGWATWRRAWALYDFNMRAWPTTKGAGALMSWFDNVAAYERFSSVFDQYYRHEINNWDEQWVFACVLNNGLCINPSVNLITNIGFNEKGTHFKGDEDLKRGGRPLSVMEFPLVHPAIMFPDRSLDAFKYRDQWGIDNKLIYRLLRPFKTHYPNIYRRLKNLAGRT